MQNSIYSELSVSTSYYMQKLFDRYRMILADLPA